MGRVIGKYRRRKRRRRKQKGTREERREGLLGHSTFTLVLDSVSTYSYLPSLHVQKQRMFLQTDS